MTCVVFLRVVILFDVILPEIVICTVFNQLPMSLCVAPKRQHQDRNGVNRVQMLDFLKDFRVVRADGDAKISFSFKPLEGFIKAWNEMQAYVISLLSLCNGKMSYASLQILTARVMVST